MTIKAKRLKEVIAVAENIRGLAKRGLADTDGDGADFKLGILIAEKILKAATGRDVLSSPSPEKS